MGFVHAGSLAVILVIGLLAAFAGSRHFQKPRQHHGDAARPQADDIVRALDAYRLDNGAYPSTAQGLAALWQRPSGEPNWNGPYLDTRFPLFASGHRYAYRSPGENGTDFDLVSLEGDSEAGEQRESADVPYRLSDRDVAARDL